MVDAIGLYAGIKPNKGATEFSYFDYSPRTMNMFERKLKIIMLEILCLVTLHL
jgi:hypothetical protein